MNRTWPLSTAVAVVAVLGWVAAALITPSLPASPVGTVPSPAPGPVVVHDVHGGAR